MAVIIQVHEGDNIIEFELTDKKIIVGRSKSSHIRVKSDGRMSGKHACFEFTHEGYITVTDMQTTNGTILNGFRINSAIFYADDELYIGNTLVTIDPEKLTTEELQKLTRDLTKVSQEFISLKENTVSSISKSLTNVLQKIRKNKSHNKNPSRARELLAKRVQQEEEKKDFGLGQNSKEAHFRKDKTSGLTNAIQVEKKVRRAKKLISEEKKEEKKSLLSKLKKMFD